MLINPSKTNRYFTSRYAGFTANFLVYRYKSIINKITTKNKSNN